MVAVVAGGAWYPGGGLRVVIMSVVACMPVVQVLRDVVAVACSCPAVWSLSMLHRGILNFDYRLQRWYRHTTWRGACAPRTDRRERLGLYSNHLIRTVVRDYIIDHPPAGRSARLEAYENK